jgi:hypothetical protein
MPKVDRLVRIATPDEVHRFSQGYRVGIINTLKSEGYSFEELDMTDVQFLIHSYAHGIHFSSIRPGTSFYGQSFGDSREKDALGSLGQLITNYHQINKVSPAFAITDYKFFDRVAEPFRVLGYKPVHFERVV